MKADEVAAVHKDRVAGDDAADVNCQIAVAVENLGQSESQ